MKIRLLNEHLFFNYFVRLSVGISLAVNVPVLVIFELPSAQKQLKKGCELGEVEYKKNNKLVSFPGYNHIDFRFLETQHCNNYSSYIRVIPQWTVDNSVGSIRRASSKALVPINCRQQTL